MPLPPPLTSRHSEVDDVSLRRQRADTLPSYIDAVSAEPEEDLPHNPKTWAPSQLSVYLTAALHVWSGARLPERVADHGVGASRGRHGTDVPSLNGRRSPSVSPQRTTTTSTNQLTNLAGLASTRYGAVRYSSLHVTFGRTCFAGVYGALRHPKPEPEENGSDDLEHSYTFLSISSFPDLAPTSGASAVSIRANANGLVRGMVDKWEPSSTASSRSSSRSDHRTATSVVSPSLSPFQSQSQGVSVSEEELSIEDLLLATDADGSWARVCGRISI